MLSPAAPFRVAFRDRDIRLLLSGLGASQAGDWLYNLALLALVYDRTGSSTWIGLTTAARVLPVVVLGPLGGALADRVDRRRLMLGADVVRAGGMALLATVAALGGPIVAAPALAALCSAASVVYAPSVLAVLPRLVEADRLPAANAARVSITNICVVAGPAFGAVLLLVGSPAIAFAVNGATFLAGGAIITALPREALRRPEAAVDAPHATLRSDIRSGWHALRGYGDSFSLVGADVVASAVYGSLTVLFVLLGDRLGLGAAGYGYLLAGLGAGGVLGAGLASGAAASERPVRALGIAVVVLGAPLPLLAFAGGLPAALLLAAIVGAGSIVTEVVSDTCLQRDLAPDVFARAYGLVLPAALAGIVIGSLLAPPCVALVGINGTFVLLGAVTIGYGMLALTRSSGRSLVAAPEPV
jgi:MFS family permease